MITLEQFSAMIPSNKNPEAWYEAAVPMFEKYEINTNNRIAGFMAQCAHESLDFTRLVENLNYSEKALNSVFGRYFGKGKRNAKDYARNQEKIANYVYQDEFRSKRGALGNVNPGDGWLFRGRGIKQLTGRNNYTQFANTVDMTAEEAAEYVSTPKGRCQLCQAVIIGLGHGEGLSDQLVLRVAQHSETARHFSQDRRSARAEFMNGI